MRKFVTPETRLINFRKPFVIFVGTMVGIILSYSLFSVNYLQNSIVFPVVCIFFIFIFFIFSLILYLIRNKLQSIFLWRIANAFGITVYFVISLIIGFVVTTVNLVNFDYKQNFADKTLIVAKVENIIEYDYGSTLYLENIEITDNDVSETLSSKATVYISSYYLDNNLKIGDEVSFVGRIVANEIFSSDDITSMLNGYGYTIEFDNDFSFEIVASTYSLKVDILNYVRNVLIENMSFDNANLAYSMLFGDKSVLPESVNSIFSIAGVLHLLAVSGLHVGLISSIIIAIIRKICKLFKASFLVREIITISLTFIFLLFYAYLCGFAVSVCRASIMVIVLLLSNSLGKRYDILCSLGIAGTIILLVSPLSLYSVGFQLSFLCIFAIITLAPKLQQVVNKTKLPEFVTSPFVVSVSVNLVIAPILMNNFGELSLISVFANIIVIPFFSIVFPLLFVSVIFVSFFKFLGFALCISDIFIQILKSIIEIFASVPYGVVSCFKVGYLVLALILIAVFLIKYLMCKLNAKVIVNSILLLAVVCISVINLLPSNYANSTMIIQEKYSEINMVLIEDDKTILFGLPTETVDDLLLESRINKVDIIIANDFTFKEYSTLVDFVERYKVKSVYLDNSLEVYSNEISIDNCELLYYNTEINIDSLCINIVKNYEGDIVASHISTNNFNILRLTEDISLQDLSFVSSEINEKFEYLIVNDLEFDVRDYDIIADKIICSKNSIDDDVIDLSKINCWKGEI